MKAIHSHTSLLWLLLAWLLVLPMLVACSSTKHVPQGEYLLDDVTLRITDIENKSQDLNTYELVNYLRQSSNHKVLGGLKLQLALYNLKRQGQQQVV